MARLKKEPGEKSKIKAIIAALYRTFVSNDPYSRDAFVEVDPSLSSSWIIAYPWGVGEHT
jgi:hypothetical protein